MKVVKDFSKLCTMSQEGEVYSFTFFCELCDAGHTVKTVGTTNVSDARETAAKEAMRYFNRCHKCEKWVCDTHYNEDVMLCTDCAPREEGF